MGSRRIVSTDYADYAEQKAESSRQEQEAGASVRDTAFAVLFLPLFPDACNLRNLRIPVSLVGCLSTPQLQVLTDEGG